MPASHVGRNIVARVGERMVEPFPAHGGERIAVHRRRSGHNQQSTLPEHMSGRLKAARDIRRPDCGDLPLARARCIGPDALAWAERRFASCDFPEQAFTTVPGMIRLADDHGPGRAEASCTEALDRDRLASGFLGERTRAD